MYDIVYMFVYLYFCTKSYNENIYGALLKKNRIYNYNLVLIIVIILNPFKIGCCHSFIDHLLIIASRSSPVEIDTKAAL